MTCAFPPAPQRRIASRLLALTAMLIWPALAPAPAVAQDSAHFTVIAERAPNAPEGVLERVSTTTSAMTDGAMDLTARGGAMEPAILRDWFVVTDGAETWLTAERRSVTMGNTLRTGVMDGAEVEILRLENGRFRHIRTARVAPGGHRPGAWIRPFWHGFLVPPDRTGIEMQVSRFWRPGAELRVAVQAVDRRGIASALGVSNPVRVPDADARGQTPGYSDFTRASDFDPTSPARSNLVSAPSGVQARLTSDGALSVTWDNPGLLGRLALQGYAILVGFEGEVPLEPARLVFDAPGPAVQEGDLAILRTSVTDFDRIYTTAEAWWDLPRATLRAETLLPASGPDGRDGYDLVPHPAAGDTRVTAAGTHFLRADVTPDAPLRLFDWTIGRTTGAYRPPVRADMDYEVSVWLRAPEGDVTARLRIPPALQAVTPDTRKRLTVVELQPGPDWTRHVLRFRPTSERVEQPTGITLEVTGSGRIDVDNMTLSYVGTPPGRAAPEMLTELRDSGMGLLRSHGFIKSNTRTYDMMRLLGVPIGHVTGPGLGLAPFLQDAEAAGTDPWIQLEPHMTAAEWQGLVEYLAAPWDPSTDSAATKPWAALRVAQGRTAPWTDSFDRILFELGNETWNRLFHWKALPMTDAGSGDHVPAGAMLGAYTAHVMDMMSQSPYWPALDARMETVIGGWALFPSYGVAGARASARAGWPVDHVGIAAYLGGWDQGEGVVQETPAGYASVLANGVQVGGPTVRQHRAALAALGEEGLPVPYLIDYEGGPGYVMDGLNRARVTPEQAARQERVMRSHAAGTATLDTFLMRATEGTALLNFYEFGRGPRWNSHAPVAFGGHASPAWDWLSVFNTHLRGEILTVRTQDVPRGELPARERLEAMPDAPLVGLHALRDGDRLVVIAASRQVPGAPYVTGDGRTRVRVDLPIRGAERLTRWQLTGTFDTHDEGADRVRAVSDSLPVPETPETLMVDLSPGSAQAFVFEGVRW